MISQLDMPAQGSVAGVILVSHDYERLRLAARELFDEQFHEQENERAREAERIAGNAPAAKARRHAKGERTLSPGYYDRVGYLLDLDAIVSGGFQLSLDQVDASEVQGLMAVREARAEWQAQHPSCGRCGRRNERFAMKCRDCGVEFQYGGK
jgi:hypothetical protein